MITPALAWPRCGLLLMLWLALTSPGFAAEPAWPTRETLPPPVVLVLKLLSETHARPITGIVIADERVLVPAGFVSAGDEIVVLDGGTDVFRHGRPTRTVHRSAEAGLAVLQVDGLRRSPARLTSTASGNAHLAAFPAAEDLAKGALPLWVAVTGSATQLPNLAGPLLNGCGQLAGFVLPGEETPTTIDPAALGRAFEEFGLQLATAACGAAGAGAETDAAAAESPATAVPEILDGPAAATTTPESEAATPAEAPPDSAEPDHGVGADANPELATPELHTAQSIEDFMPAAALTPVIHDPDRKWTLVMMTAFLVGLMVWVFARHKRGAFVAPVSNEPATEELLPERAVARNSPTDLAPAPTNHAACQLLLQARLPGGKQLVHHLAIPADGLDLCIGRSADWAIDHPSLSRAHARIRGDAQGLYIEDLDSTNGTLLGRVPCLPGEIFHLHHGDTVLLGEIAVTVTLQSESPAT